MHFGPLRVINEDWVAAGTGFGMHPHKDMEIVTYLLEGELTHQDSMGHHEIIRPNEVQRMSAGTGVFHSEFNRHATDTCHLLQIWIMPDQKDLTPEYEQTTFDPAEKRGKLRLVAAPDGAQGPSPFIRIPVCTPACLMALKLPHTPYPRNAWPISTSHAATSRSMVKR